MPSDPPQPDPSDHAVSAESDQALIERIVRRDVTALTVLYDRYSGTVYGLSLRVVKDPAEATQVLTDVFFEVWEKSEKFHPDRGSLRNYLMLLARSRAIDSLRRRRRTTQVEGTSLHPGQAGQSTEAEPSAAMIAGEESRGVREALAQLPEAERLALELAFFEGLTHLEIAERTQTPLGTIKSRIRRGLVRMRDRIVGLYGPSGDQGKDGPPS